MRGTVNPAAGRVLAARPTERVDRGTHAVHEVTRVGTPIGVPADRARVSPAHALHALVVTRLRNRHLGPPQDGAWVYEAAACTTSIASGSMAVLLFGSPRTRITCPRMSSSTSCQAGWLKPTR